MGGWVGGWVGEKRRAGWGKVGCWEQGGLVDGLKIDWALHATRELPAQPLLPHRALTIGPNALASQNENPAPACSASLHTRLAALRLVRCAGQQLSLSLPHHQDDSAGVVALPLQHPPAGCLGWSWPPATA